MRRPPRSLRRPVVSSFLVLLLFGCSQREPAPIHGVFGQLLRPQEGDGGSGGTAGSGGDAGTGGTAGSGGDAGSGGTGGTAGSGGTAVTSGSYTSSGGGCACHLGTSSEAPGGLGWIGLVPVLAFWRRRRGAGP